MAPTRAAQLNIRSAYARARAHELARMTGMTAAQVVEEALRAYVPAHGQGRAPGLVRVGPILVKPASGRAITQAQADAALEEARQGGEAG